MEISIDGLRILVVEDSFEAMNLIKGMLADLGIHEVYTAKNGVEALDFLGSCDDLVDVVLCDWNMPRMTGLDLLKQVRMSFPGMPFLMVTARGNIDSVMAAKKSGVSAYVVKPFSPAELEQKVVALARRVGGD